MGILMGQQFQLINPFYARAQNHETLSVASTKNEEVTNLPTTLIRTKKKKNRYIVFFVFLYIIVCAKSPRERHILHKYFLCFLLHFVSPEKYFSFLL